VDDLTRARDVRGRRSLRVLALAVTAAAASIIAFPAFLALRAMGSKQFEPEPMDFTLVAVATFTLALGAQIAWRSARYVALLAMLAAAALLFGVLAAFSIGLAILPAGVVFLVLLYRAVSRTPGPTATRGALGGAAMGFALPLLYIGLILPATVECFPNGGATSSRRWHAASQLRSTGRMEQNGVQTGTIVETDSTVAYRCESGRLVEFSRTPK